MLLILLLSVVAIVAFEERVQQSEEKLSEVSHSVEASQKQLSEPWLLFGSTGS